MTTLLGGERHPPRFDGTLILNTYNKTISLISCFIPKYNNFSNRLCNGKILP